MSYIVFARKWRPKNLDEVVGQEHITSILKNSIQQKRLAHAYLFAGPRGVGKTSCARILAKSLNCVQGATLKPCEQCPSCRDIAEGRSLDVIEIDGASNRGIDEIRTLRENVKFAPISGAYKIYIIDEVHMLTTEAFNALLKTLEEPPPYVKFFFATTQPQKVISTILSRCQRFDFRPIPTVKIIEKLEMIARSEHLAVDKEVLFAIAKAASGGMRDAETILDQLSSYTEGAIRCDDVNSMLGMIDRDALYRIVDGIIAKDTVAVLGQIDTLIASGKDIHQFINDLIEHFRNLMIVKIAGKLLEGLLDMPEEAKQRVLQQSQGITLREILGDLEEFFHVQETARFIEYIRIPLEMALTKITYTGQPSTTARQPLVQQPEAKKPVAPVQKPLLQVAPPKTQKQEPPKEIKSQPVQEIEPVSPGASPSVALEQIREGWPQVIQKLAQAKMSVATYLQEGTLEGLDKNKLVILFPPESKFHKEFLEHKDNTQLIQKILKDIFAADVRVSFSISRESAAKRDDTEPIIQSTLETFKGKVIGRWYEVQEG